MCSKTRGLVGDQNVIPERDTLNLRAMAMLAPGANNRRQGYR